MQAMEAATDGAPAGEQLYTRGGPNVPDNRGLSMVQKHLEKQQKEKETRAMERLHLLLPALGPTVRAVALQECHWDEERALTMLRRFQVAKTGELSALHKERRRHQMHLQSGRPERRKGKKEQGKKKRRRDENGEGGSSGSESGSDSGSDSAGGSGSGSSGSDSGSSSSEEERGKKRGGGKKRSTSRSRSRSPKRSRKERKREEDKGRRGKKEKKEKKEKRGKREKTEKRERRKEKKVKTKKEKVPKGVVGMEYGKYGLIRETDLYNKRPEFQLWAIDVKKIDIEAMPRSEEKEMFTDFMEEYNTASLPHKKYYNLELYEKQQAARAARKGITLVSQERTAFDDETERRKELAAERARQQAESLQRAYEELKTTDKAQDMREQQMLRAQMTLAYQTGDRAKAEKLAAVLKPVELADIGKNRRPAATGT